MAAMRKALSSETTIEDELLTLKHTIIVPARLVSVDAALITPWFSNERLAQEDLYWRIMLGTRTKDSSEAGKESVCNRAVSVQAAHSQGVSNQENCVDVRTTKLILSSIAFTFQWQRGLEEADEYYYDGEADEYYYDGELDFLRTGTWIQVSDIDEASNLSLEGQVTIFVEIQLLKALMEDTLEMPSKKVRLSPEIEMHCKTVLNQMLDGDAFKDVALKFGKEVIKAHRIVLSANSRVFATLLKDPLTVDEVAEVAIKDIRPEVMQVAIQHMYGMDVKGLGSEMYMELLRVADKYQISTLKATCEDFLMRDGSVDVLKVLVAAEDNNATRLKDNILERVLKHPSRQDLLKDDTLDSIVSTHPKLVANLLKAMK